jgi:hypothetical protein
LVDPEMATELKNLIKELASEPTGFPNRFNNILQEKKKGSAQDEHMGEARPKNKGEPCDHPLLVPDSNDENCILG